MYTLFLDTDMDITPEMAKACGAKLISMPYTLDEKTIYPYIDFEEFDYHAFYERLRQPGPLPTTSALSPVDYVKYFEPEFKAGKDILYVHFSAAMTSTFNSMRLALEELKEKYPERQVYEVDTKGITIESLGIALEICDMYKAGKSVEEILNWAEEEVEKFAIFFYADDLKFFHRSGRVGGFSAFFGNILGIKPIITMDTKGTMQACGKGRGRQQSLKKILDSVVELEDNIRDHRVIIGHTDALPIAEEFAAMLKKQFGDDLNIMFVATNPTAGAHCGPNAIGVCFHAKHR